MPLAGHSFSKVGVNSELKEAFMKSRKIITACVALMTILEVAPVVPAFQIEDTTKAVTKRTKKTVKGDVDTDSETATAAPPPEKKAASVPAKTVSESDIAAAKAEGKVWVNTETGVYHKGGKWYGATKQGKFMTEQEAIKAGYRASKTK